MILVCESCQLEFDNRRSWYTHQRKCKLIRDEIIAIANNCTSFAHFLTTIRKNVKTAEMYVIQFGLSWGERQCPHCKSNMSHIRSKDHIRLCGNLHNFGDDRLIDLYNNGETLANLCKIVGSEYHMIRNHLISLDVRLDYVMNTHGRCIECSINIYKWGKFPYDYHDGMKVLSVDLDGYCPYCLPESLKRGKFKRVIELLGEKERKFLMSRVLPDGE